MITTELIRERLKTAIKQSGITQTELAKQLGIIQQSIAQYLSGRAMPSLETFANLCAVLDLDANEILCLNERDSRGGSSGAKYNIGTLNNHGKIDMK